MSSREDGRRHGHFLFPDPFLRDMISLEEVHNSAPPDYLVTFLSTLGDPPLSFQAMHFPFFVILVDDHSLGLAFSST